MDVLKAILAVPAIHGALAGAGIMAGHDLYTWSQSEDPFNLQKALKKWFGGALAGSSLFGVLGK